MEKVQSQVLWYRFVVDAGLLPDSGVIFAWL